MRANEFHQRQMIELLEKILAELSEIKRGLKMSSEYPCGNHASCDIGVSDRGKYSYYDECFPEPKKGA